MLEPLLVEAEQKHYGWLHSIAFRIVRNREDADDIVQIAFQRLWERSHIIATRELSRIGAWLRRTVINEALAFLRRRKRQSRLEEELRKRGRPFERERNIPVDDAYILWALPTLIPEQDERTACIMRWFGGLPYKSIGEALNIKEGTAKNWVWRNRMIVEEQLPWFWLWHARTKATCDMIAGFTVGSRSDQIMFTVCTMSAMSEYAVWLRHELISGELYQATVKRSGYCRQSNDIRVVKIMGIDTANINNLGIANIILTYTRWLADGINPLPVRVPEGKMVGIDYYGPGQVFSGLEIGFASNNASDFESRNKMESELVAEWGEGPHQRLKRDPKLLHHWPTQLLPTNLHKKALDQLDEYRQPDRVLVNNGGEIPGLVTRREHIDDVRAVLESEMSRNAHARKPK